MDVICVSSLNQFLSAFLLKIYMLIKSVSENANVGTNGGTLRSLFVLYPIVSEGCL